MTTLQTHFDERGEAHINESQLEHLNFDTNPEEINELVTTPFISNPKTKNSLMN